MISPNASGGGATICYEQLLALSDLRVAIVLWHQTDPSRRLSSEAGQFTENESWNAVRSCCISVAMSEIVPTYSRMERARFRVMQALNQTKPLIAYNLRSHFETLVNTHKPDFIWAQHFQPALLATRQRRVPVVYSHHDWMFRIIALRSGQPEDSRRKREEFEVVRRSRAVVCGSQTECNEAASFGCGSAHYIPTSYVPVEIDWGRFDLSAPRLVHLGGMATTASRKGLHRFLQIVWPRLRRLGIPMDVVGDLSRMLPPLATLLQTVNSLGFVADLSQVLRPGDLQIIPWEHNTGQRTRFPLALNYGQVVVATKASVACFPEAVNGKNCRLVEDLEDMGGVIEELCKDSEQRERLARAGRDTFLQCFTREALLPRYRLLLQELLPA